MSTELATPEEEAAYEEWLEDEGRLWAIVVSYQQPRRRGQAVFAMNHRDAIALCSDDRSKGRGWMAVHSRLEDWQEKGKVPARYKIRDTGRMDDLIEELGLTKIPL